MEDETLIKHCIFIASPNLSSDKFTVYRIIDYAVRNCAYILKQIFTKDSVRWTLSFVYKSLLGVNYEKISLDMMLNNLQHSSMSRQITTVIEDEERKPTLY